jgi:ABC-type glutathione transport system ATPase component
MLELVGISKIFRPGLWRGRTKVAVGNISWRLESGEVLGLIGESGCGKSTVARIAVKLLQPSAGRILIDGDDVTGLPERNFRKLRGRIQIVFQHPEGALDPYYTLGESIHEAFGRLSLPRSEWVSLLQALAAEAGLPLSVLGRRPAQVSGGEIQRAVLARVLALRPRYLILDEPTSMLDLSVQAHILQLLKRRAEEGDMGLLFVSHDLEVVRSFCDRVLVMKAGRIVEEGPVERIFSRPSHAYTASLVECL